MKITYADKKSIKTSGVSNVNQVTSEDINEIKRVINSNDEELRGTIIYNNATNSSPTITLEDSAANYNYFRIFYRNNNSHVSSFDVSKPNNKTIMLQMVIPYYDNLWVQGSLKKIVDNQIISQENGYSEFELTTRTYQKNDRLFITKVIGYKEM